MRKFYQSDIKCSSKMKTSLNLTAYSSLAGFPSDRKKAAINPSFVFLFHSAFTRSTPNSRNSNNKLMEFSSIAIHIPSPTKMFLPDETASSLASTMLPPTDATPKDTTPDNV